jgi:hypothetical protein
VGYLFFLFLAHASLAWHLLFLSFFGSCFFGMASFISLIFLYSLNFLFGGIWREVHNMNGVFILVDGNACFCVTLSVRVNIFIWKKSTSPPTMGGGLLYPPNYETV